jgi:hypothetical protein
MNGQQLVERAIAEGGGWTTLLIAHSSSCCCSYYYYYYYSYFLEIADFHANIAQDMARVSYSPNNCPHGE